MSEGTERLSVPAGNMRSLGETNLPCFGEEFCAILGGKLTDRGHGHLGLDNA